MPAKPSKKNSDKPPKKKQADTPPKKKKVIVPKPKKLSKKTRQMLRQQRRREQNAHANHTCQHIRWRDDTASNNWYEDTVDFNWNGLSFEQQQSRRQNHWHMTHWRKDDYYRSMRGHQQTYADNHVSELNRRQSDPSKIWSARSHCDTAQASSPISYSNLISLTVNNRIPPRTQNIPPRGLLQGHPATERPTSPSGGSKLDMSLKTSISNILKGHSSVSPSQEQADSTGSDHGEALLQRAENMCRQFRESRALARKEQENKKKLERSALDEQIVVYGERTRLKVRGVLPETTQAPVSPLPSTSSPSWCGGAVGSPHTRHGTGSCRGVSVTTNIGAFNESRTQVRPVRDEPHLTMEKQALPGGMTRVRRNSGETLNRDRINKLVNAPRSRKERLQLEKILHSHKPSGRPAVRPKLHLETSAAVTTEELDISELPGDILQQIELLIQGEMDVESEGVIHLGNDIIDPPDVDGTSSAINLVNDDLCIEDLCSEPVCSSHSAYDSGAVYTSVASTNRSLLGNPVAAICQTDTSQTPAAASENANHTVMAASVCTSQTEASTSCIQPASTSTHMCSSGTVHIKTECDESVNCSYSIPTSNSLRSMTIEPACITNEHRVAKSPERTSGSSRLGSPHTEKSSDSPRVAQTLDIGVQVMTDKTQDQNGGDDGVQVELTDASSKRRSQISTCVSQEAKRQRVNSTKGNVTSSPTCMGHDVCTNMNATSSTGEDTLARVLVISLRENQIVNKLSDTGTAIEKLEKLLKETREQLDRRLTMKQELLDEQQSLRVERLKILSEHKLLATPTRDAAEINSNSSTKTSSMAPENMSFAFSAGTTVGGNGEVTQPLLTSSTGSLQCVQLKQEPVSPPSNPPEICPSTDSVSSATDSTKCGDIAEEGCRKVAGTKLRIPRKKSNSFCMGDGDSVGRVNVTAPGKSVNMPSGMCLNYVGTLEGQGAEAEPFLKQVTELSPFVFLEQLPGHWVTSDPECSTVENADEGTPHKSTDLKISKIAAKNGSKSAEKRARMRRNSSAEVSSDSAPSKQDGCFKKPKRVGRYQNPHADRDYARFKKSINATGCLTGSQNMMTKSRSHKKVSEVYPGPDANVHKKLKSKKARKLPSSAAVRDSSLDSSSECNGQPDVSVSSTSVKQSGKKRPNKRCSDPISKAVQQYLHAESSSDVEITGLQTAPAKPSTRSCQSVASDSSVDDTSSVGSTASQQSTQVGEEGEMQGAPPGFISLVSSDGDSTVRKVKPKRAVAAGCFEGHEGPIRCIYLWNEKHLLTGSEDGTVRQFKLKSRLHRCSKVYSGHTQGVSCIHVSDLGNEGTRLFTGSYDGNMLIFSYKSGVQLFVHHYSVQVNTMHADWNKLFLGLSSGSVIKYDFQEYRNGPAMSCADSGITCLVSATEGMRKLLCVASNDCTISIRDAITGLLIHMLDGHTKTPLCLCVVNHLVYSGGTDKSVQVYNLNTAELLKTLRFRAVVTCIDVRDNLLFIASYDGTVRCYDTQTYKLQKIYYGAGNAAVMAMTVANNVIYTGNREGFCEGVQMNDAIFKCEYGGCDLVFATKQYLHHHVMTEHTCNLTKNDHCQWLNCNTYLKWKRNAEAALKHISGHILDK